MRLKLSGALLIPAWFRASYYLAPHNHSGLLSIRAIHGCHLANRFILEPNDYEVQLIVAGLAHYTRFGFAMKPTAWSKE